ncbi:MAG: MASE1 domain-containing protein, partial [Bacteroidota bacterium]|nr:MASE1 domain-containing protein [Bacteroidota bacterium]
MASLLHIKVKSKLKYNRDTRIIVVAIAFYASACLGYLLTFDKSAVPIWPPAGVGFALLMILGRQAWPGIMIGSLIAGLMSGWNNNALPVDSVIAILTFTAIAHTAEALVGCWLVKYWIRDAYPFKTSRGAFQFLFVAVLMCVVGAILANFILYSSKAISEDQLLTVSLSWLIGNIVGVLLFAPLILSLARRNSFRFSPEQALEVSL